jgi:CheY-like chemotaxis protein
LKIRLASLGYSISAVAATGADAIQKTAATRPDMILLDIRLQEEMDGIEAAREIQSRFDIPIIYMTALGDPDTLRRAEATKPSGILFKPLDYEELQAAIEAALLTRKGTADQ